MISRRLIDTNLIIRHLVQDHERYSKVAARLFESCDRGELALVILPAVLAECVFVLESFYKHSRADIARVLSILLSSRGIELSDLGAHIDALHRYANSKIHFVDCTIAAIAAAQRLPIATFDNDFKKFSDIRVDVT